MPTYAYAGNNPIRNIDPDGRCFFAGVDTAACVAAAAAAAEAAAITTIVVAGSAANIEKELQAKEAANSNVECGVGPKRPTFCVEKGGPLVWKLRGALYLDPCLYRCNDGSWVATPYNAQANTCLPWINR